MNMTSETFDRIRFYAEILGHIFTFILAVSEIVGFRYGVELAGIVAAANICIGGIVDAARKKYNENKGEYVND